MQLDGYEWGYYLKYGWITITWMKIMHPGYWVQDLLGVKSIPAAKPQSFVNISGAQKPAWAKFWEFGFFLFEKIRLY